MTTIRMHEDHPATCFCCVHFIADFEGDLSEITKGNGTTWDCRMGLLYLPEAALSKKTSIHAVTGMAQTCEEYVPEQPKGNPKGKKA